MSSITVPFDKLCEFTCKVKHSGRDCVALTLLDPEEDSDGDTIPATLVVNAFCSDIPEFFVEEYIESVDRLNTH